MTADQLLEARERRYLRQIELLDRFRAPLVSLTAVTPGADKDTPTARRLFALGLHALHAGLTGRRFSTLFEEVTWSPSGNEALLAVDADAREIKRSLTEIEEDLAVGRLFDFDVTDADGSRVSRIDLGFPARRCLLCSRPYYECTRERSHPTGALIRETERILAAAATGRAIWYRSRRVRVEI